MSHRSSNITFYRMIVKQIFYIFKTIFDRFFKVQDMHFFPYFIYILWSSQTSSFVISNAEIKNQYQIVSARHTIYQILLFSEDYSLSETTLYRILLFTRYSESIQVPDLPACYDHRSTTAMGLRLPASIQSYRFLSRKMQSVRYRESR